MWAEGQPQEEPPAPGGGTRTARGSRPGTAEEASPSHRTLHIRKAGNKDCERQTGPRLWDTHRGPGAPSRGTEKEQKYLRQQRRRISPNSRQTPDHESRNLREPPRDKRQEACLGTESEERRSREKPVGTHLIH